MHDQHSSNISQSDCKTLIPFNYAVAAFLSSAAAGVFFGLCLARIAAFFSHIDELRYK